MFLYKKISLSDNQKAIFWSFFEKVGSFIANFILQIILARLLLPDDFAVLMMLVIFISVSQVFIDGGFATVLIQKQDCDEIDYNTVFVFNVLISIAFYILFYGLAPYIESFYNFNGLALVIRIYFLTLIINAISMINRLLLIKCLRFNTIAKINTSAILLAAIPTIILAYLGFGYWTLVCQNLVTTLLMTIGYIISSKWTPSFKFSWNSLRAMFPFGFKVFIVDLFYSIYNNLYSLLIGKRYSPNDLGYYDRGKVLGSMGPIGFSDFFMRALYPIQSKMNSNEDLERSYNRAFECSALLIIPISVFVSMFSEETIFILYGNNWLSAAAYTSIMSIGFVLYPFHSLNTNMLKVKARGDYLLKSELIKKILGITIAFLLIRYELYVLLVGWLISTWIDFIISEIYLYKSFSFSLKKSLKSFMSVGFISIFLSSLLKILVSIWIHDKVLVFLLSAAVFCLVYMVIFRKKLLRILFNRS